jgi:glycosyltransferase involved in cell wall biosynthesis
LPSYREGLPKALIEASAAGRAIVTTDVPGCRDVVRNGVTGILVQPKQSLSVADAIASLASDAQLRLRYAQAARLRAESEFSLERIIAETLKLYQQMSPPVRT